MAPTKRAAPVGSLWRHVIGEADEYVFGVEFPLSDYGTSRFAEPHPDDPDFVPKYTVATAGPVRKARRKRAGRGV